MKVKKLIQRIYEACVTGDVESQKTLWKKTLEKSVKHKKTHAIK